MAFTINTNIASLQSQEYLRVTTEFQQKTINRVTSGLRIISSGDDAAGLAIANSFRSDRSVLSQGVRNANDGLSTLQTIDGGINNISQLLDRARTLAAQSASGTFTGDRSVLNSEFVSVIQEIDRQAQAIGLNTSGIFAKNLSVFIGGGRGLTDADQITNGSVAVDLSNSTVDARSLGLKGVQVSGANAADVDEIVTEPTNTSSVAVPGYTDFYFRGAGFSDQDRVRVSVNLSGVDSADKLVKAINSAIDQAGADGSAFKNAGVRAGLSTDADGTQKIVFESSSAAFQVSAGDRLANALLGNHTDNVGTALDHVIDGGAHTASTGSKFAAARDVIVRIQGGSLAAPADLTLSVTTATTIEEALTSLTSLVANNASLIAAGISITTATAGSALQFTSKRGEDFEVLAANDIGDVLGLGTAQSIATTGTASFDATSITSSGFAASTAGAATLAISVGGGNYATVAYTFTTATTVGDVIATLNTTFASNTTLHTAATSASAPTPAAPPSASEPRPASPRPQPSPAPPAPPPPPSIPAAPPPPISSPSRPSAPATTTRPLPSPPRIPTEPSTPSPSPSPPTAEPSAAALSTRPSPISTTSSRTAAASISPKSSPSRNAIPKPAETRKSASSALSPPSKSPSATTPAIPASPPIRARSPAPASSTAARVSTSPSRRTPKQPSPPSPKPSPKLGKVQAVVGRGQNQFNFAISLAQTQINNLAASESRIRDADLAAEAANLTRAQILQQAGIAAMAQANVAPQAVLSLLQG